MTRIQNLTPAILSFFLIIPNSGYSESKEDNMPVVVHGFMTSGVTKGNNSVK